MEAKYKITNTTVKLPRFDQSGRDTRKHSERSGHTFSFTNDMDGEGKIVMVMPGKFALSSYVNEAMMNAESKGIIKIEEVKDMGSVLETYRSQKSKEAAQAQKEQDPSRIKSSPMGDPVAPQRSGIEMEGAVNPDGDPNFIVRAPSAQKAKESNAPYSG